MTPTSSRPALGSRASGATQASGARKSTQNVSLVDAVLERWSDQARDLPWRRTRDSWSVLVSELMLQQTQVARVIPKYRAFLARFPTLASCAAGSVGEVITLWEGLGYNRRAVSLHRCAVTVVERHDGQLPQVLDELMLLPGIGPYTARALLAFAFERDVAVLDTNVARIVARAVHNETLDRRTAQSTADALVPDGRGWDWNQAILDFGATICTKRSPRCAQCPARGRCAWRLQGGPDPAVGSAAVTGRQSRFEGSHRQGRGRLVSALRRGPVALADVPDVCGWPEVCGWTEVCGGTEDADRSTRAVNELVQDGLAVVAEGRLILPGTCQDVPVKTT